MRTTDLLICPICQAPFTLANNTLVCPQGHSFDIAREGYSNLARKQLPGDTREMLQARRAFFARGHYRPLAETINELVAAYLPVSEAEPTAILDAGCGEGYYLAGVQEYLRAQQRKSVCVGIDISREAARMAARRYREALFLVANLKEPLPLRAGAFQALLNIFAPRNPAEFARVLAPDGILLIVIPGPDHLRQLRETLHLLDIEADKQQHVQAQFAAGFELLTTRHVRYELLLQGDEIAQAVMMTPNYWHLSEETRRALAQMEELRTDVEFVCLLFRR